MGQQLDVDSDRLGNARQDRTFPLSSHEFCKPTYLLGNERDYLALSILYIICVYFYTDTNAPIGCHFHIKILENQNVATEIIRSILFGQWDFNRNLKTALFFAVLENFVIRIQLVFHN